MRLFPRRTSQMPAQLLVSQLVDTDASTIACASNIHSALVPEMEHPLRPCSVDHVGSAVARELSSHPGTPAPHPTKGHKLLCHFSALGGGERLVSMLLLNDGEERLLSASTLADHHREPMRKTEST